MPNNKKKPPKIKQSSSWTPVPNRRTPADYKKYRKSQASTKSRTTTGTRGMKSDTRSSLALGKARTGAAGRMAKKSGSKGIKRGKRMK